MSRLGTSLALFGLATIALSRCAAQQPSCVYPAIEVVPPALAYPEDGATGVPDDFGTILYYYYNSELPVRLKAGTTLIATTPGTVPSPLPSPIATSPYGGQPPTAARAVPSLSPQTTYTIQYEHRSASGCPMMTTTGYTTLGSFTTQ